MIQTGLLTLEQIWVFAPLGAQTGWVTMNDNGINGDEVPGDGIYSVELSLRTSTPIGTHEIQIQAIDSFDVATPITPVSIVVQEETSILPSLDSDSISTTVFGRDFDWIHRCSSDFSILFDAKRQG